LDLLLRLCCQFGDLGPSASSCLTEGARGVGHLLIVASAPTRLRFGRELRDDEPPKNDYLLLQPQRVFVTVRNHAAPTKKTTALLRGLQNQTKASAIPIVTRFCES